MSQLSNALNDKPDRIELTRQRLKISLQILNTVAAFDALNERK